jgi:hypothetical protein
LDLQLAAASAYAEASGDGYAGSGSDSDREDIAHSLVHSLAHRAQAVAALLAPGRRALGQGFGVWSRVAAKLSGQIQERARAGAAAAATKKQTTVIEAELAEEKQKAIVLERALLDLRQGGEAAGEAHTTALAAAHRILESERARSEQLRVQLLKHVAISNSQNAELQKSRQICANLSADKERSAVAALAAEAAGRDLQRRQEAAAAAAEEAVGAGAEREAAMRRENQRLSQQLDISSQQAEKSLAENAELQEQAMQARAAAAAAAEGYAQLQSQYETIAAALSAGQEEVIELTRQMSAAEAGRRQGAEAWQDSDRCLGEARVTISSLRDKLSTAEEFSLEQKGSLEELCSIVVDLKAALKKNHSRCKHIETQRDEARQLVSSLRDQQHTLLSAAEADKVSIKRQYSGAMEALQAEVKRLGTLCGSLEAKLESAGREGRSQRGSSGRDLAATAERLAAASGRVQECEHALRVKDKLLDDQAALIADLRARLGAEAEEAEQKVS